MIPPRAVRRIIAEAPLRDARRSARRPGRARNVILFIGDGMGISTIAATRVFSVGVDGELVIDQFPHSALSRTADADHITADSASAMTAMMTGIETNSGVIGFGSATEFGDFNGDGDGPPLPTLLEAAKQRGMKVGIVTTARVTHATPAACYAHIDDRDQEADIALQAFPGDAGYNRTLGTGLDLLMGGGRQFFVPTSVIDEEGGAGSRIDGRDLRAEFQAAGYRYVWNRDGFESLCGHDLPVLGLFERSHMEYEFDRPNDLGGEPSLTEMTEKAIELLDGRPGGYFLMVEAGRIDRYSLRPASELGYPLASAPAEYLNSPHNHLFDLVYDVDGEGNVVRSTDRDGVPYTILGYQNGPGYRGAARVDPITDPFPGQSGRPGAGPNDSEYRQEAAVPLASETHAGEDVALFAIGAGSAPARPGERATAGGHPAGPRQPPGRRAPDLDATRRRGERHPDGRPGARAIRRRPSRVAVHPQPARRAARLGRPRRSLRPRAGRVRRERAQARRHRRRLGRRRATGRGRAHRGGPGDRSAGGWNVLPGHRRRRLRRG